MEVTTEHFPLVSIIIPTYNRAHLIGETLDSVLAQTYKNWECIVVDDGSSDNTAEVVGAYVEKDARFQFHQRPEHKSKGANACRNYGFKLSKGSYFMFLDSDDLLASHSILKRVGTARDTPQANVLIFKMQRFLKKPGDQDAIVNRYFSTIDDYLCKFLSHDLPWPISALFLRKEMKFVTFNEELQRFQDVEYSVKLLFALTEETFLAQHYLEPDCYYRVSEDSRYKSIDFLKVIAKSLLVYFKSIDGLISQEGGKNSKKYKEANYTFFLKTYKFYILPSIKHLKGEVKPLRKYLRDNSYFSSVYYKKLAFLEFLHEHNIHQIKGSGVYRLTNLWLTDGKQ